MSGILPEGEALRKAVKWISEERLAQGDADPKKLVEQACLAFNLSPRDEAFLYRLIADQK